MLSIVGADLCHGDDNGLFVAIGTPCFQMGSWVGGQEVGRRACFESNTYACFALSNKYLIISSGLFKIQ